VNRTELKINPYLLAIICIGITALLCAPLSNTESYHVVSFILLFVVSILATFLEIGPVLLSSTLSALVWNFFFIPPHLTFHIDKTDDTLIFGMFFVIALVNGVLTTRVRHQEKLVRDREVRTDALFQLTRQLSKAGGIEEVLAAAIVEIRNNFAVDSFFVLQDGNNILQDTGRLQKEKKLNQDEYQLAEWVFNNYQKAGAYTSYSSSSAYTFFPLPGARLSPGVLAIKSDKAFWGDQEVFWDTFITQISNALEREFLGEMAQKARFFHESDRLYKTLFNSISHEFRIPVATIMGASDTLLNSPVPNTIQLALCSEIFIASIRLNRLIENLLNMSRLESGHISVRLDWYDVNDLVNKVSEDLKDELKSFPLVVLVPEDMPLVKIDYGLMEQVLYNLFFNASQYAPVGSEIMLEFKHANNELVIVVEDKGPGFPQEALPNVFQKFFRVNSNKTGGLGLGLSIVKGFVEAHHGTIEAANVTTGGARFSIKIPSENPNITNIQTD
jgi:two-component system sensor histidine kinase KdpD